MDAPLPFHERLAVGIHLMMCRYCARFRTQLHQLRKMSCHTDEETAGTEPATGLSRECKDRIKAALHACD